MTIKEDISKKSCKSLCICLLTDKSSPEISRDSMEYGGFDFDFLLSLEYFVKSDFYQLNYMYCISNTINSCSMPHCKEMNFSCNIKIMHIVWGLNHIYSIPYETSVFVTLGITRILACKSV